MQGAFDYYSLIWMLALILLPAVLTNIALVVVWIVRDAGDRKQTPLWNRKVNRKDLAGYKLTGKNTFATARLKWLEDLGRHADCRLSLRPVSEGRLAFRTRVPAFDMHFAVREAPAETIANLWANEDRLARAVTFLERRLGKIDDITIEGGTITFDGKYGSIDGDALPDMIAFANAFWGAAAFPPLANERVEQKQGRDYRSAPADPIEASWLVEVPLREPRGPVPTDQVVRWLYAGAVIPTTRVAPAGTRQFRALGNTDAFRRFFGRANLPAKATRADLSGARQKLLWYLRRPHRHIVLALATIVAFGGAASLAKGKEDWDLAIESVAWPTTGGVVTESKESCSSSGSGSNRKTSCSHAFKYRFEVAGKKYEGNRIHYGAFDESIETRVKSYPVGKKVQVNYRPSEPFRAVVEPGTSHIKPLIGSYVPLVAGLGLTLVLGAWRLSVWWGGVRRWWMRRRHNRVGRRAAPSA
ncbi:MAG: DUF3592 domain-containing protein [Myxococcota bacterium]